MASKNPVRKDRLISIPFTIQQNQKMGMLLRALFTQDNRDDYTIEDCMHIEHPYGR